MQVGRINTLKVVRKTDLGYMLSNGKNEVLMHHKEALNEVNINDMVEAFVFYDKQGRLCATTKDVFATLDKPGFATVIEVVSNLGVFVDINTSKDILISKDYLPYDTSNWPLVDEKILIGLKVKKDKIVGKPLNKFEIDDLGNETLYDINTLLDATVYRVGENGVNLVTDDLVNVFVHKSMIRDTYHLGQRVSVKIVYKGKQGYSGSLIDNKEKMIVPDKQLILKYLELNNGKLRLDAKSSSEEIENLLHISRKAFKRALGGLYKDHIVDFKDGYTIKL